MTPFDEMKPEQALFDKVAMNDAYLKKDVISDKDIKPYSLPSPTSSSPPPAPAAPRPLTLSSLASWSASGCTSATPQAARPLYSGGAPILPYCKDNRGFGPAWEHSLFEDNAEFAFGFFHAQDAIRKEIIVRLEALK